VDLQAEVDTFLSRPDLSTQTRRSYRLTLAALAMALLATDRWATAVRTHLLPRLAPLWCARRCAGGPPLPDSPVRVGGRWIRLHELVAAPGIHDLVRGERRADTERDLARWCRG